MLDLFNFDYVILLRLLAAVLLGGIIGLERGGTNHDAGLRTHIIVCLGAATVMAVSESIVSRYDIQAEVMRMGAQVISGVGFLGAGSIIVDGNRIRGITTAAGLWTTACIGIAIGSGFYVLAFAVVVLLLFTMLGLRSMTYALQSRAGIFSVQLELDDAEKLREVFLDFSEIGIEIRMVKIEEENENLFLVLEIKLPKAQTAESVMCRLSSRGNLREFTAL